MGRDREEMALKMVIACMTLAVAIYAVDTSVHELDSIESGFGWWDFIMMGGQGYSTFDYMMEERDLGESQGSAKVLDRPVRFAPELLKKVKDLQIQDGIVTSPNSSAFCVPDLSSLLVETEKELEEKLLVETKEGSFKEFAENFPMLRRHICDNFDYFFSDGVMSSGEVVGSIFFTGDKLFWMEQLSVGSGSNFIDDGWFEIEEDSSWDVFTSTSLGEECVESIVSTTDRFIGWHLTVWLNSVLEAEKLPAGITDLDTALTDMDRNDFSHCNCFCLKK